MAVKQITLNLPDVLLRQVEKRARRMHRSLEGELVALLTGALPMIEDLAEGIGEEMTQMSSLNDVELWQIAETKLSVAQTERMEELTAKRQLTGLSRNEENEITALVHQYDRTMLLRAQAMVLLKERGQDVSMLIQSPGSYEP